MIKKALFLIAALSFKNIQPVEFKKFWQKKEMKTLLSSVKQPIVTVLTIKNNNGNINISESHKKTIDIKATIKGSSQQLQNISLEQKYDTKNNNLTIYTKSDLTSSIDYEIEIPSNLKSLSEIKIDCEDGDLSIINFNKAININANKANVIIENSKQVVTVTLKTGSVKLITKELSIPNNIFISIENYGIVDLSLLSSISSSLTLQTRNGRISSLCPVTLYPPVYLKELSSKEWNNLKKDLKIVVGDCDDESKLAPIIVQLGSGNILVKQH